MDKYIHLVFIMYYKGDALYRPRCSVLSTAKRKCRLGYFCSKYIRLTLLLPTIFEKLSGADENVMVIFLAAPVVSQADCRESISDRSASISSFASSPSTS